jgi:hypothetical protein
VTFNIVVTNRGATTANEVTIRDTYYAGLQHVSPNPIGRKLGNLAPGESRQFSVTFRATKAGQLCHRVEVVAADGGHDAQDSCVDATETPPPVLPGRLAVRVDNWNTVTAGKPQQFLVQVTNEGDAADNDMVVTIQLPRGSSLVDASGPDPSIKFEQPSGTVRFSPVAELPPKAVKNYRIAVTTARPGPLSVQAEATSRRQTQPARGSTTVEVLPD